MKRYTIIHHSDFFGGNASEYIVPNGKINITSHGLGSGIYGLSQEYIDKNPPTNKSQSYIFTIENPYIISNMEQGDIYMESSMTIMREIDTLIKHEKILNKYTIDYIVKNFVCNMSEFSVELVSCSLLEFCTDYYFRKDIVEMPINYILKKAGYDGIISKEGTSTHNWSRGDVKFIDYPTYKKGNRCDVGFILSRSGVSRPLFNLKSNGYVFYDDKWEKMF